MKKFGVRSASMILWASIWLFLVFGFGALEGVTVSENSLTEDWAMHTEYFNTDIVINENQSYEITENIGVDFLEPRQGIYRYIPYKGTTDVPYYAKITDEKATEPLHVSAENGYWVGRLGTEGIYKSGRQEYQFSYTITPQFQSKEYNAAFYNVTPPQWQNRVPAGSRFTVTFPKDFEHSRLKFYYGTYGETKDTSDILELSWNGNTLTGILRQDLELGEGITFWARMEDGYFTGTGYLGYLPWMLLLPGILICLLILFLFIKFGRDEQIIPSIQYQPPDNLDSAAVGYIIDGSVEDKDLLSLIIYWADKGYLRIEERKDHELCLYKLKNLPDGVPSYQSNIFNKLFQEASERNISDLQYKFAGTMEMAKKQLRNSFKNQGQDVIYTRKSKISRVAAILCCTLPFAWFMLITGLYSATSALRAGTQVVLWIILLAGVLVFCAGIDTWYSKSGSARKLTTGIALGMCIFSTSVYAGSYAMRALKGEIFNYIWILIPILIMTGILIFMAGFMKSRTPQCVEWMGHLAGLREFIQTAELDRMNELAKTNPRLFYHIIPYAYVFGLSEVFAEKLKGLSLPAPEWYAPYHNYTFFDYYMFNRLMISGLDKTASTLSMPRPEKTVGSGGSGGFGGMSGGGGFSGGGFGGGGGGSW